MEFLRVARGRQAWTVAAAAAASAAVLNATLPPPQQPLSLPVPRLPPPKFGERITVLSIDGGGIRGLIPTVVIDSLEKELQVMNHSLYTFVI